MAVLRREFTAEPGSFLLKLRIDLEWDRAALSHLERAMRALCVDYSGRDQLDRWLAEGFFYVSTFVRDHTSQPNFPRPTPESYYEACLMRLWDLADWFFSGYHGYNDSHVWVDL
jgi:hypothetical protein